jgi:hypothetical protein
MRCNDSEELMSEENINRRNCGDHTGHEERIRATDGKLILLIWLIGILIALMTTCTGALYSSVQSMNTAVAVLGQRFAAVESKMTALEAAGQRRQEKLMELEFDKK